MALELRTDLILLKDCEKKERKRKKKKVCNKDYMIIKA